MDDEGGDLHSLNTDFLTDYTHINIFYELNLMRPSQQPDGWVLLLPWLYTH